jgi:tetratricopeptide (TPR) repeat protein
MLRICENRWIVAGPAFLVAILGLKGELCAQASDPSAAPSIVQPASAPVTPARTPTPEETGDSLAAHQRYQSAIEAYSKAPEMTAELWNKMGISYQMMLNSHEAMRCYKESLKLDPRNPLVLNNLGTVYASLKDYGQADRLYRKAIKLDPRNAPILKNLGTNLLAEKRYDKGWAAYQEAIAVDPEIFNDRGNPKVENPASIQDRGAMNYYMALGCARSGYADCALQYLRAALDEGFTSRKKVAADAQFASLRANPAFQQLLAEPSAQ